MFKVEVDPKIRQERDFWPAFVLEENQFPQNVSPNTIARGAFADQYVSLSKYEYRIQEGQIQKIKVNGYAWKTALKIATYIITLFILPIAMFIAKVNYKEFCSHIKITVLPNEIQNPPMQKEALLEEQKKEDLPNPQDNGLPPKTVEKEPEKNEIQNHPKQKEALLEEKKKEDVPNPQNIPSPPEVKPEQQKNEKPPKQQELHKEEKKKNDIPILHNSKDTIPEPKEVAIDQQKEIPKPSFKPQVIVAEVKKVEENIQPNPQSETIYAMEGMNQYNVQNYYPQFQEPMGLEKKDANQLRGQACCTNFALAFVALKEATTPESLGRLLLDNVLERNGPDAFMDIEDCKKQKRNPERYGDLESYIKNPSKIEGGRLLTGGTNNVANIEIKTITVKTNTDDNIATFLRYITANMSTGRIDGCVMSSGFVSVALRKYNNRIEFFDPHGSDISLPNGTKPAYVIAYPANDVPKLIESLMPYLKERLKNLDLGEDFELAPPEFDAHTFKIKGA